MNMTSQIQTAATDSTPSVPADPNVDYSRYQSLRACLARGWRVFADHPGRYIAWQLPGAVLRGLGLTLLLWYVSQIYAEHIHPAYKFWKMGATDQLVWDLIPIQPRTWLYLALIAVCCLLALYLSKGYLWVRVQRLVTPAPEKLTLSKYGKNLLRNGGRCFLYDLLSSVVFLILAGLVALLSWKTSWWCLLLLLPIGLVLYVFTTVGRYALLLTSQSLRSRLSWTWRNSKRYGGAYLLLLILTGIPYLLLCCALLLPVAVFTLAILANAETLMTGALSGLPGYFPYLYFFVGTLCFALCALFASMRPWSLALKTRYLAPLPAVAVPTPEPPMPETMPKEVPTPGA